MSVSLFYTQKYHKKSVLSDCLLNLFSDSSDQAFSGHAKKKRWAPCIFQSYRSLKLQNFAVCMHVCGEFDHDFLLKEHGDP